MTSNNSNLPIYLASILILVLLTICVQYERTKIELIDDIYFELIAFVTDINEVNSKGVDAEYELLRYEHLFSITQANEALEGLVINEYPIVSAWPICKKDEKECTYNDVSNTLLKSSISDSNDVTRFGIGDSKGRGRELEDLVFTAIQQSKDEDLTHRYIKYALISLISILMTIKLYQIVFRNTLFIIPLHNNSRTTAAAITTGLLSLCIIGNLSNFYANKAISLASINSLEKASESIRFFYENSNNIEQLNSTNVSKTIIANLTELRRLYASYDLNRMFVDQNYIEQVSQINKLVHDSVERSTHKRLIIGQNVTRHSEIERNIEICKTLYTTSIAVITLLLTYISIIRLKKTP